MGSFLLSVVLVFLCLETADFYNGFSDFFSAVVSAVLRTPSYALKGGFFITASEIFFRGGFSI